MNALAQAMVRAKIVTEDRAKRAALEADVYEKLARGVISEHDARKLLGDPPKKD